MNTVQVEYKKTNKSGNSGTFTLTHAGHTIGNLLTKQLLVDTQVTFAGYIRDHPLQHDIRIRIQTKSKEYDPQQAFNTACKALTIKAKHLQDIFVSSISSIQSKTDNLNTS